jgi:PAS domain S-box-containing protein
MLRLDNIKGNALAIESAERPSVLGKRPDLIDDFKQAVVSDYKELTGLKKLYKYNFLPVGEMKKFDGLVQQKIKFTQNIINLIVSGKKETAIKIIEEEESITLAKLLKNQDQLLENEGRKLLHNYHKIHDADALKTEREFLLLGVCLFLFLGYALYRNFKDSNNNFKIAKENKFLTNLFNRAEEAVIIANDKLNIIYYNMASGKLFKRKPDDVIGKPLAYGVGLVDMPENFSKIFDEVSKTGRWSGELGHYHTDGTPLHVYISISSIKDANGKVIAYSSTSIDFTEYKKTIENKSYLATIFENSYEAIVGADTNYCIKAWNKAAEIMFGYSVEEALGKPVSDLLIIDEDYRKGFRDELLKKGGWKGKVSIINKRNQLVQTHLSVSCIKDDNGNILDYIGTYKDISEITELQEELQSLNYSLQQQVEEKSGFITEILERISDGFVAIDREDKFTYINSYIGKITGVDVSGMVGKNYLEVFPALKETAFVAAFHKAIKTQQSAQYEVFSTIWKMWLDITIYPSSNGVSVYLKDITKRKEKDEQLLLKDTAIEGSINGVGMTDLSGNIIYANEALVKMWGGKKKEDLIGLKLTEVFAGQRVYQTIEALQTKGFDSGEDIGKKIDGSLFDVDFVANVIFDETKKPLCMVGFFVDISNRKKQTEEINKLVSIIENSFALVGIMSLDNKILYLNTATKKLIGVEKNENISNLNPLLFFPEETRTEILAEVFEKGYWSGENFLITKSQQKIPIIQHILLHKNERGEPLYISSNALDLTELKQKQEIVEQQSAALALQNSKLEAIYNSIQSYLLEVDRDSNIISLNKTRMGLNESSLIGQPFSKFLNNAKKANEIKQLINDIFENKSIKQIEADVLESDGRILSYFGYGSPIIINGEVQSVLLTIADVSELKSKQSELEKLATIIEKSISYIGLADMNRTPVYFNKSLRNAFGVSHDADLSQYKVFDFYSKKGKRTMKSAFAQLNETGYWIGENEMCSLDGRIIPVMQSLILIKDEKGVPIYTSSNAIDITELKARQNENQRLADIIDNSLAFTGIANLDENIIYSNKEMTKVFGLDKFGKETYSLKELYSEKGKIVREEALKVVKKQGRWQGENEMVSTDGKIIPIYQTILAHKNENNEIEFTSTTAIDITDLKRKQEESELYLSVLNNSTAYFSIADEQLNMVYANQSFKDIVEIEDDITHHSIYDFKSSKGVSVFLNPNHSIHKEKKWVGENYYKSKSGKDIPVLQVIVLHEFDGKVKYISSTAINISEIKENEKEKERLIQLINSSPAFFAMTDLQSNAFFANAAIKRALGINDEYSVIPLNEFRNEKGAKIMSRAKEELQRTGSWQGENYYLTRSGKKIPVLQALHLHKEENGKPAYISATSIDISQLKENEKELNKLAGIIENTKALVLIVDLDFKILYLNKAAKERFEIGSNEDISELDGFDFVPNDTKALMKAEEAKFFSEGKWIGELNFKTRNGKTIPVLEVGVLHKDENGTPQYMSFTLVDITEQKEAEKELVRLNIELRELSNHLQDIREEERSEIAREIHDVLGQNLTVLKMAASWIKKHLHDNLAGAERRLEELMDVTDETIQSSRKLYNALHPNMLDDIGLVAAIQWHANTVTKTTGIDIEVFSNLSNKILSSKLRLGLYRIYQESVTNILRHANASHVTVNLNKDQQIITMSVSDNGNGFDTTKVDILHSHGLLGMRERVYAMSGKLNINTEINKGTLIEVIIPVAKELEGPENFENVI